MLFFKTEYHPCYELYYSSFYSYSQHDKNIAFTRINRHLAQKDVLINVNTQFLKMDTFEAVFEGFN